jgi:hypothetical protein
MRAVEALIDAASGSGSPEALRDAADALDEVGPYYGRAATAVVYAAFAELLRITSLLIRWRQAVLSAEADADRFLRAAKEQQKLWVKEYGEAASARPLQRVAARVVEATAIADAATICDELAATPLPVGIFSDPEPSYGHITGNKDIKADETPPELAVAFLKFSVNGEPARHIHHLTPGEAHDLEVEVRVSRWPTGATQLILQLVSIEPESAYDFPRFAIPCPEGKPPFCLRARGRAILKVAQSLQAEPFEFRYTATFTPTSVEQPVAVIGQRTLSIETVDIEKHSLTGYAGVDQKIVEIRNQIRKLGLIPSNDIRNAVTALQTLGNLSGRALQDALYQRCNDEPAFQREIRADLRRDPRIGSELEEHARAGAGITDLSFRGIRIELKYEKHDVLLPADCDKFVEQTLSYVVGTGKRIGLLVVLDNSEKTEAPFPAEDGMRVVIKKTDQGSVCVIVVLMQGNLARPSDLSR